MFTQFFFSIDPGPQTLDATLQKVVTDLPLMCLSSSSPPTSPAALACLSTPCAACIAAPDCMYCDNSAAGNNACFPISAGVPCSQGQQLFSPLLCDINVNFPGGGSTPTPAAPTPAEGATTPTNGAAVASSSELALVAVLSSLVLALLRAV